MKEMKRQTELDILRFGAIFAVILMHANGHEKITSHFNNTFWGCVIASTVWCVPVFFMISGRFFLDPERENTIEKIFKKNISHMVIVFIVWSLIYSIYYYYTGAFAGLNKWGILEEFIQGPFHFWYLLTLISLYMLTPFLRLIVKDKKLTLYFLAISFLIILINSYVIYIPKVGHIIDTFVQRFEFKLFTGYVTYYILGYFIYKYQSEWTKKKVLTIYLAGILMYLFTIIAQGYMIYNHIPSPAGDFIQQYQKINVIIYSSGIYFFFVNRVSQVDFSEKTKKIFARLTEYSFGVFILHGLVNSVMEYIPLPKNLPLPGVVLILYIVLIYLGSLMGTYIIRKIPVVGKWIT